MAVDVRPTTLVRRARIDVATVMFDPAHDTEWTGGITASRPAQPGLLAHGSTVERDAKFLGRSFTYGYVVTADEPNTMVAIHATGEPGGFFGWAAPLMARAVRKNIAADLERLRLLLER